MKLKQKIYAKFTIGIIIGFVSSFFFTSFMMPIVKAETNEKTILILCSYNRGQEWTDRQVESIMDRFNKSNIKYSLYIEYLDWKRYPTKRNTENIYEMSKYKYSNKKLDLIMTTDDAALEFALKNRKDIFSGAPIVFSGVLKESADILLKGSKNVTGVYEGIDAEGTIKAASQMIPNLKEVYILHDKSESGIAAGNSIKDTSYFKDNKLKYYELSDYSIDEIMKKVSQLESDSIVMIASYNRDTNNLTLDGRQFGKMISGKSAVPIFTTDESFLGTGCIGGSLKSGSIHGDLAGELGIKILEGMSTENLPMINTKPVFYGFDYNVIKNYNIDLKKVPQNAEIINKPFSFYENYRSIVNAAVGLIVLLIILISILLIHIRFKKKAEIELKNKNSELMVLYKKVTVSEKEVKAQQENIYRLAYYNSVTQLPNKIMLKDKVQELLSMDQNRENKFGLIYIDIDNLKDINDSFGHLTGDKILYSIGRRLKQMEQEDIKIYHLGGDEFVIIFENIADQTQVEQYVKMVNYSVSQTLFMEGSSFSISSSIGIVIYPFDGQEYTVLLKNAHTSMNISKRKDKGSYTFYDKSMGDAAVEKIKMQSYLRKAIKNNEFTLHYQPQFDIERKRITSFESLIRWNSPQLGLIPPLKFIHVAEESRLIVPIGNWVLEKACLFIKTLNEKEKEEYIIAVNISVIQLIQEDFVENVFKILGDTGISPNWLELEITESILMNSFNSIIEKLNVLRSKGVRIALDDFGTGYSSLSYLYKLPISTLKIDKAFISSISVSNQNKLLTGSIIEMGHIMGLEVVAEGIETQNQQEYLTEMRCDRIQGYLISKPIPEEAVESFLHAYKENSIYIDNPIQVVKS